VPDKEKRLKKLLDRVTQVMPELEFVVLDCPPNLGVLTFNALETADEVIVPVEPSFFSLHGLAKMTETLRMVSEKRQRRLDIHALLTLFDSRTCFAREVYEEVRFHFKQRLFHTIIHDCVHLREAASAGQSIVDYDQGSPGFQDYLNLTVEYLEREWDRSFPAHELGWNHIEHHRYGPRRVMGGTLFQTVSPNAREVEIAGDFNQWVPEPLVRRGGQEGLWQKVLPLMHGHVRYKFIIDGEWQVDPFYPVHRENAFGSQDTYLEIE